MRIRESIALLMVLAFWLSGCGTGIEESKPSVAVDEPGTQVGTMDRGHVRNLASRAARAEGYDLKKFAAPKITFDSKAKQWSLFFEGTVVPAPGNHFWVLVDGQTGKASVRHGE